MNMKKLLCLFALLLCTTAFAQPQQLVVGVSGNGYVTRQQDGARITQEGVAYWTNPKRIFRIYFYLNQPTTADFSLMPKDTLKSKSVMEKRVSTLICNRMISPMYL